MADAPPGSGSYDPLQFEGSKEAELLHEQREEDAQRYRTLLGYRSDVQAELDVAPVMERQRLRREVERVTEEMTEALGSIRDADARLNELRRLADVHAGGGAEDTDQGTWGLRRIEAHRAWVELGVRGDGATLAVIGTGVDPRAPGIEDRLEKYRAADGSEETPPEDQLGSGTQAASIAVGGTDTDGVPLGVAPNARLLVVDIFRGSGTTADSDILLAIQWSIEEGADVILLTFGTPTQPSAPASAIYDAVALNTLAAGATIVAPVGNSGAGIVAHPANVRSMLTVGAIGPEDRIAAFSGGGFVVPPAPKGDGDDDQAGAQQLFRRFVKPDVCAPGVEVLAATTGGTLSRTSGTLAAAAHVAGVLALMVSARNRARAHEATDPIRTSELMSDVIETADGLGEIGKDQRYGEGVVNAYQAVRRIQGRATAEENP